MVRSIRAEVVNFWGAPRDEVRVRMVWNAVGRGGAEEESGECRLEGDEGEVDFEAGGGHVVGG